MVSDFHVNSDRVKFGSSHFLTTVKQITNYFKIVWSLLINMEHNLYDNDTDDYYDDDSDTLIMDFSDISNKLDDSGEETESLLE